MPDIGAYELGLRFTLDAQAAHDGLKSLTDQIQNVTNGMAEAGPKLAKSWDVTAQSTGLATAATREARREVAKFYDDVRLQGKVTEEGRLAQLEYTKALARYDKVLRDIQMRRARGAISEKMQMEMMEIEADAYKEMEEQLKKLAKLNKEDEEQQKRAEVQQKTHTDFMKDLIKLSDAEKAGIGGLTGAFDKFRESGTAVTLAIDLFSQGLKTAIGLQEQFADTNLRAAGSNDELRRSVLALQTDLGVTSDESSKAFLALAAAGVRAEEGIDELARTNVQFTIATGASAESAALLQKRMVELYGDAGLANETLALMASAAEKAGLSANDLNTMMTHLSDSLIQVEAIYGAGAGKRYADALIGISAAAKEAGADLNVLAGIMKKLADKPLDFIALLGAEAITGEPAANMELLVGSVGDLREQMDGMAPAIRGIYLEAFGLSQTEFGNLERLYDRFDGDTAKLHAYMEEMKEAQDMDRQFAESMDTVTRSLKQAIQPLLAMITSLADMFLPILQAIFDALHPIVKAISATITVFLTFVDGLGAFGDVLKVVIPLLLIFGLGLVSIGKAAIVVMLFALGAAVKWLMEKFEDASPEWQAAIKTFGIMVGVIATFAVAGLALMRFAGAISWVTKILGFFRLAMLKTAIASKLGLSAVTPGKGLGFAAGMRAIAEGFKQFAIGAGRILGGAIIFGLAMAAIMLPMILLMKLTTGGEMLMAAGALLATAITMRIMAPILQSAAKAIATAAPELLVASGILAIFGLVIVGIAVGLAFALWLIAKAFDTFSKALVDAIIKLSALEFSDLVGVGVVLVGLGIALSFAGPALIFGAAMLAIAAPLLWVSAIVLGEMAPHLQAFAAGLAALQPYLDVLVALGPAMLALGLGTMVARLFLSGEWFVKVGEGIKTLGVGVSKIPPGIDTKLSRMADGISDLADVIEDIDPDDLVENARAIGIALRHIEGPVSGISAAVASIRGLGSAWLDNFLDGFRRRKSEMEEFGDAFLELAEKINEGVENIDVEKMTAITSKLAPVHAVRPAAVEVTQLSQHMTSIEAKTTKMEELLVKVVESLTKVDGSVNSQGTGQQSKLDELIAAANEGGTSLSSVSASWNASKV